MFRRWHHGHSLGAGILFGLAFASYRTWLFVAAAFLLGLASGRLRTLAGRLVAWLGGLAHDRRQTGIVSRTPDLAVDDFAILTLEEREQERQVGLRQGEAAGIRAAARQEARDLARRFAIRQSLDRFTGDLRADSLNRALNPREGVKNT